MNGLTPLKQRVAEDDVALMECSSSPQAYLESKAVTYTKALVADLYWHSTHLVGFRVLVSIRVHDDSIPKQNQLIVMSPSGVQKERMVPEDMYVLSSDGLILSTPPLKPYPHKPPKCTDCAPLFMKITILVGRYVQVNV
ncbi:haloacid dehalogenase-like hydrolase family protein [Quillaja saponaria]|uniref:Haloacid dehalogenase-like hydrolase family protein n=1 Tax=Quillaja saponaria TaxID=32244 RepID=A0AAD7PB50_QUISA|nr:haloacid dehalogenase-like hydrolase family protein [Quillaja saponaria]